MGIKELAGKAGGYIGGKVKSTVSGKVSSVLGTLGIVEKAYIKVKNPNYGKKNPLTQAFNVLESEWQEMKVQFNPSSLRLSTRAGSFQQPVMGGAGISQINQITMPAQTTLDLELIFDDVNKQDAFGKEKFTNFSADAIVSDVKGAIKSFAGDGYSVQEEVEGLVGLIVDENARQVQFCWGNMIFAGEVTSISATYTMFNSIGHPIRAKIALSIQQNEGITGDGKYWDSAFDKMFGK